jgi:hypothetical protein
MAIPHSTLPSTDSIYPHILYIVKPITFSSSGAVTIGTLPANSLILKNLSGLTVNVAFNAATTNVVDIGTSADDDFYATDLAAGSIAFVPLDEAVTQLVTSDTIITATYAQSGTAATAGSGYVTIAYVRV